MKQISVVMATYNGEKYLDKQIQSILRQSFKPAQVIVCDDRSTDSTVAILKKYSRDSHLTYVVNDTRLGFIENFKKAVSLADSNNYISLADQDDEWLPDKLERSAKLLEKIDDGEFIGMVYSDLIFIDEHGIVLNNSFMNEIGKDKYRHNLQTLLFNNFVTGCTIMMNSSARPFFAAIPADTGFHDEWIALAAFTFGQCEQVKTPLVKYRKHDNNMSITADGKPVNRYKRILNELMASVTGKDNFLVDQLKMVRKFYNLYHARMEPGTKLQFEQFLLLQTKPYLFKKAAFRKMMRDFKTNTL